MLPYRKNVWKKSWKNIRDYSCGMMVQWNVRACIFYGLYSIKNISLKTCITGNSVARKLRKIVFGRITRSWYSGYFIRILRKNIFSGRILFIVTVFSDHKLRIKYFLNRTHKITGGCGTGKDCKKKTRGSGLEPLIFLSFCLISLTLIRYFTLKYRKFSEPMLISTINKNRI